jgi:hypothetical protein
MSATASLTAERLRAAVSTGNYRLLDQLLDVYRMEVEASWKAAATAEQRREISSDVTALLGWARHAILVSRAHAQGKLLQFKRRNAYANAGAQGRGHLSLEV